MSIGGGFFRQTEEPDDELDEEFEGLVDSEAPLFISLHHHIPLPFGSLTRDGLLLPDLPAIDEKRAYKPASPGMSPIWMPAPFDPDSLRLLAPPGVSTPGREVPAPRIRLGSVARSPFASPADVVPPRPATMALPVVAVPPALDEIIGTSARLSWGDRVDPMVAFIFYAAFGAGIAFTGIDPLIRLTVLWTVLLLLGAALLFVDATPRIGAVSPSDLLWGFGIGLIVGLPTYVVMNPSLVAIAGALFPEMVGSTPFASAAVILFQIWVLLCPLSETVFFRATVQKSRDLREMISSVIAAGANNLLFFLPIAIEYRSLQAALPVFYLTLLAGVFSFVRRQYGFTAALICQIAINIMLLFIPGVRAVILAARTP